VPCA